MYKGFSGVKIFRGPLYLYGGRGWARAIGGAGGRGPTQLYRGAWCSAARRAAALLPPLRRGNIMQPKESGILENDAQCRRDNIKRTTHTGKYPTGGAVLFLHLCVSSARCCPPARIRECPPVGSSAMCKSFPGHPTTQARPFLFSEGLLLQKSYRF